jgi:hypothetical protein
MDCAFRCHPSARLISQAGLGLAFPSSPPAWPPCRAGRMTSRIDWPGPKLGSFCIIGPPPPERACLLARPRRTAGAASFCAARSWSYIGCAQSVAHTPAAGPRPFRWRNPSPRPVPEPNLGRRHPNRQFAQTNPIRPTKSEIRISKSKTNLNDQDRNSKRGCRRATAFRLFGFRAWGLFRISGFVLRISNAASFMRVNLRNGTTHNSHIWRYYHIYAHRGITITTIWDFFVCVERIPLGGGSPRHALSLPNGPGGRKTIAHRFNGG